MGFLRVLGSCIPAAASAGTEAGLGAELENNERELCWNPPPLHILTLSDLQGSCFPVLWLAKQVYLKFLLWEEQGCCTAPWFGPSLSQRQKILEEEKYQETHHRHSGGFLNLNSLLNLLAIFYFSELSDSWFSILSRILNNYQNFKL